MNNNNLMLLKEYRILQTKNNFIVEHVEEGYEKIILKGKLQEAEAMNHNERWYPMPILEREIENFKQLIRENRSLGECVTPDTEVLTINGWKPITNVEVGEKIFTLNLDTNEIQIQENEIVTEREHKEDMIHIYNNSSLDMMLTPKHQVVLWDRYNRSYILTAQELMEKINSNDSKVNHSYIKKGGDWIGETPSEFIIPNSEFKIKPELWVAFLGLYLTEGYSYETNSKDCNKKIVVITQKEQEEKDMIRSLIEEIGFEYTEYIRENGETSDFYIYQDELYEYLLTLGNSKEKYIPNEIKNWNKNLLSIMLDWMLIGDGRNRHNYKNESLKKYTTISKKLAEDVLEIMIKLGNGGSIRTYQPQDRYIGDRLIEGTNSNLQYTVYYNTSKGIYLDSRFVKAESVPYNGNVYCVTVPNKTWLMKYNNKINWTHNCDHPDNAIVNLANVSHIIRELWWKGKEVWGRIELLNGPDPYGTPSGRILESLVRRGVTLGISSRGIGSTKTDSEGREIVQPDYQLITWDFVSNPSTHNAFMLKENRTYKTSRSLTTEERNKLKYEKLNNVLNTTLRYEKDTGIFIF
jgi:uncharacterized protein YacL (UPF0231 family)